jgi:hypothetical protein
MSKLPSTRSTITCRTRLAIISVLLEGQITRRLPDYIDVDTLLFSRTSEGQRVVAQNIYRSWDAGALVRNFSMSSPGE